MLTVNAEWQRQTLPENGYIGISFKQYEYGSCVGEEYLTETDSLSQFCWAPIVSNAHSHIFYLDFEHSASRQHSLDQKHEIKYEKREHQERRAVKRNCILRYFVEILFQRRQRKKNRQTSKSRFESTCFLFNNFSVCNLFHSFSLMLALYTALSLPSSSFFFDRLPWQPLLPRRSNAFQIQ